MARGTIRLTLIAAVAVACGLLCAQLWAQDADDAPAKAEVNTAPTAPAAPAAKPAPPAGAGKAEGAPPGGFAWWRLVKPLGILTFVLFATTLVLGLLVPRNRAVLLKWHKVLAVVAILLAACHAAIVISR